MKVAVVGGGVSGLACAYKLAKHGVHVVLYEKQSYLGGHNARTVSVDGLDLDLSFMIGNQVTCPETKEFLEELGVVLEASEMSFAVSVEDENGVACEWASKNGLSGFFDQKKNMFDINFWRLQYEFNRFKKHALHYVENTNNSTKETMGQFIHSNGYSKSFQEYYLIPICTSIWACSIEQLMGFSAYFVLSFCKSRLQGFGQSQSLTTKNLYQTYVNKVVKELEKKGEIKTDCSVKQVISTNDGILVNVNGKEEFHDRCIISAHASTALNILSIDATIEECQILGAYQNVKSEIYLHQEKSLMPRNTDVWSDVNFLGTMNNHNCVTYWFNTLQNSDKTRLPNLITLNPLHIPKEKLMMWTTSYPIHSIEACEASKLFHTIQGKRGIWYCGAYQGYGFYEDGVKAGLQIADDVLGLSKDLLTSKMERRSTWIDTCCRLLVINFLQKYIQTGCICIHEGDEMLQFEGKDKGCNKRVVLHIQRPEFYWKVATRMDLGLADSYINGDFVFENKKDGLLDFLMICIANENINVIEKKYYKRDWSLPRMTTTIPSLILSYLRHISKRNSLTQARRNISRHYDLSNDMFSLFLDETMSYSCAIYNQPGEPLKDAQMRKIHLLIKKAQIDATDEVLEIGFGWGSLAIEVVRLTNCKYTGLTLSQEQLKFAQERVKKVGLEEKITLLLCDYREIPRSHKYNRIISCGMLEHVGDEYYEEFFNVCENTLKDNGRLVLQFISVPDQQFYEIKRSVGFLKEYIFPGGCLPSLSRLTLAMTKASTLWFLLILYYLIPILILILKCKIIFYNHSVEHLENIGPHYYYTLMEWRNKFHSNKSDIMKLGFGEEFIRTWDYYFVYCAAGFQTLKLLDYQVIFSKPEQVKDLFNLQDYNFLKRSI